MAFELFDDERRDLRGEDGLEALDVRVDFGRVGDDTVDRDERGEHRDNGEDGEQGGATGEDGHLAEQRITRGAQPVRDDGIARVEPCAPALPDTPCHRAILSYAG